MHVLKKGKERCDAVKSKIEGHLRIIVIKNYYKGIALLNQSSICLNND